MTCLFFEVVALNQVCRFYFICCGLVWVGAVGGGGGGVRGGGAGGGVVGVGDGANLRSGFDLINFSGEWNILGTH